VSTLSLSLTLVTVHYFSYSRKLNYLSKDESKFLDRHSIEIEMLCINVFDVFVRLAAGLTHCGVPRIPSSLVFSQDSAGQRNRQKSPTTLPKIV